MNFAHRLSHVLAPLLVAGLSPVACGDGDSSPSDGSGATSSGGSSSSSKGGNTSKGGGSSNGGDGTGNEGGDGTASGGDGSSSAGTGSGSGGDGTAGSGAGGEGSGDTLTVCQEECQDADDCLTDFTCDNGRCVPDAPACTGDDQCVASASGWVTECADDGDCLPTQACVDVGEDSGRCAIEPGAITCEDLMMEDIEQPRMEGGGTVTVCGNSGSTCQSGSCFTPCSEDSCPANFECNTDTGQCDCTNDDACADVPNTSV